MKKTILFACMLAYFTSCISSPYTTKTPADFVNALGQIGERPKDENPIPYFYTEESAKAITAFDEIGAETLKTFKDFQKVMNIKFPKNIKESAEGKLKVQLGDSFMDDISFSLSAKLIRNQIQGRTPDDYEFISASEPNADGAREVSLKIMGNETKFEVKNTKKGYRMFLDQKNLESIKKMTVFFQEADKAFKNGIQVVQKEITEENFREKIEAIYDQYATALNILNQ